jgi:outer membrane lipoprotein-sorting protein
MKTRKWLSLFFILFPAALWASVDAAKILEAAENIRNPQYDYESLAKVVDVKGGKVDTRIYRNQIKGRSKAIVHFLTPAVDKGTKVLLVEDQMWIYMPSTAKPIRISARQKLVGNAAYGDIARLNFTGNYTAKFLKEATLEGKKAMVLELIAIEGKPVTYDRVEYWVDAQTHNPLKALYMTSSGKILREGYFEKYENVLGVKRPSVFVLKDYLEPKHVTRLIFSHVKKATLPDLLFEKENFERG